MLHPAKLGPTPVVGAPTGGAGLSRLLTMPSEEPLSLYQYILDAAPDGVIGVDGDGRIVMVNKMMETIFGYEPEELIGQLMEILLPDRYRKAHRAQTPVSATLWLHDIPGTALFEGSVSGCH